MIWTLYGNTFPEDLGFIPGFLNEDDPARAREQLDRAYGHGGGWNPARNFTLRGSLLCYPGDPPLRPMAATTLGSENVILYPFSWVVITQPDGTFEVARMD